MTHFHLVIKNLKYLILFTGSERVITESFILLTKYQKSLQFFILETEEMFIKT